MATGILVSASAVSTQSQDIFDDIGEWFENDFVDFWKEDFVGAFEDLGKWFETDFVDFWEQDFVDFWTDDLPDFIMNDYVDGVVYLATFGHNEAYLNFLDDVVDGFEDMAEWFSGDFVDFFENDFVEFWEEDFVDFWEVDFVDFLEDLPALFAGTWHGKDLD